MRVIVTGGSGLAGFAVVKELVAQGYDVISADITPPPQAIADYKLIDCRDAGQVMSLVSGADAVVHLAAIPRPTFHTPHQVFSTNVMSTYNVFEAVSTLGIARVVYVSSVSVLGPPFSVTPFQPLYVPIDEAHPRQPEDAYALSKYIGEEIATAFTRRQGGALKVVSLRFPWIHNPHSFREQLWPQRGNPSFGASNLWSYIDTRDVGRACRLALLAEISDHTAVFVSAANTFMPQDSATLVQEFFPATEIRPSLEQNQSLLDCSLAARVLDFEPAFSWENYDLPA